MSDIKLADNKGLIRGDDYTLKVSLNTDITGATVFFTVNEDDNPTSDNNAVIQKINGPSDHDDAETGKTNFIIDAADTHDLEPGVYNYDIQVVTAGGKVASTRRGRLFLDSDITRSTSV